MPTRSDQINAAANGAVYWLLVLMGVSSLAMCVLWPEWRQYQALQAAEQLQRQRLESLRSALGEERRRLQALQDDPGFIARLARRELNYRGPSDVLVPVVLLNADADSPIGPGHSPDAPAAARRDSQPPPALPAMSAHLPHHLCDRAFCDSRNRRTIAALSVALLVAAIILFWRPPSPMLPGGRSSC